MSRLRLLLSDSHDPLFNLAVEECIFRQMDPNQRVLFLWRNANTVVIGRAQNPWKECNTRRMEEDGVTLARRSSGGGAVFHDLGNSCFTFMAGKPEYDKSISTAIVLDALKRLGVEAFASGRNDLLVATPDGERKVSGSAYRRPMIAVFTTVPCCWTQTSAGSPTTSIPTPRSWRPRASARCAAGWPTFAICCRASITNR